MRPILKNTETLEFKCTECGKNYTININNYNTDKKVIEVTRYFIPDGQIKGIERVVARLEHH